MEEELEEEDKSFLHERRTLTPEEGAPEKESHMLGGRKIKKPERDEAEEGGDEPEEKEEKTEKPIAEISVKDVSLTSAVEPCEKLVEILKDMFKDKNISQYINGGKKAPEYTG